MWNTRFVACIPLAQISCVYEGMPEYSDRNFCADGIQTPNSVFLIRYHTGLLYNNCTASTVKFLSNLLVLVYNITFELYTPSSNAVTHNEYEASMTYTNDRLRCRSTIRTSAHKNSKRRPLTLAVFSISPKSHRNDDGCQHRSFPRKKSPALIETAR